MEKLNSDIAEEEAKREEQRVRFVEGIRAQVEEKGKSGEDERAALMSREDFMRQTNEMAQRLKNWDWNNAPEIGVSAHYGWRLPALFNKILLLKESYRH